MNIRWGLYLLSRPALVYVSAFSKELCDAVPRCWLLEAIDEFASYAFEILKAADHLTRHQKPANEQGHSDLK